MLVSAVGGDSLLVLYVKVFNLCWFNCCFGFDSFYYGHFVLLEQKTSKKNKLFMRQDVSYTLVSCQE